MAFTKYASLEVSKILDIKGSAEKDESASLSKIANFEDYRTEDGYLYARIRAISSRVNKNHDGWPSIELAGSQDIFDRHVSSTGGFTVEASKDAEYGFSTFLGKPIFVDHHNSDPSRARGVIVDAKLHVEDHKTAAQKDSYYRDAPANHTPPTWVELLLEVDAKSFPKLAKAIIDGSRNSKRGIDGFSMGCDVERSVCNICKNSATTPNEFCKHVQMKGAHFDSYDEMGRRTSKRAYEDCYGIKFFEISAVFDPADETALVREVRSNVKEASMNKTAEEIARQETFVGPPISNEETFPQSFLNKPADCGDIEDALVNAGITNPYETPIYVENLSVEGGDKIPGSGEFAPGGWPSQTTSLNGEVYITSIDNIYQQPMVSINQNGVDWSIDGETFLAAINSGQVKPVSTNGVTSSMNKFGPISEYDKYFGGTGAAKKAYDSMIDQYGEEKGKEVFYATMNKKKNQHEKKSSESGFVPPKSVQNNARRGLEMAEAGEAGDGLESATKTRARAIASGKALSLEHVKRMHSFFERHDKTRPNDGGKGNSPWKTAWMLWGGDSGRSWAESVVGKEVGHDKSEKTADSKPQYTKTRAPEKVDTHREDKICDICGEIIDGQECEVCGNEVPPKSFDDPDLTRRHNEDEPVEETINAIDADNTNISPTVAHVTTAQINKIEKPILPVQTPPASNEPKDYVVKDQKEPVTSSVRTASDFLDVVANEKQRNNMETHIADAQTSAPAVAKPDHNTEVEGVGGVGEATNESASKADAQVNVADIGGVSGVGTGDEKTTEVAQGDEYSKNIKAIHTDTFGPSEGDSLGQHDPVSREPFPASDEGVKSSNWVVSDVKGVRPADPIGEPDERIDVTDDLGPDAKTTKDSGPTSTWTGTDGNGVTRQQDPVTNESSDEHQNSKENHPSGVEAEDHAFGDKNAHLMTAFKLADTEIELGILDPSQKYARVAELEKAAPSVVEASLAYANRVKTAGLKKSARVAKRLPSLVKGASTAPESTQTDADDSALFM